MQVNDFGAPGSEEINARLFGELVAKGGGHSGPILLRRGDNGTIWIDFSVSVLELDGQPTVLAVGQDVSEKVRAAEQLAAAEAKYRSLIERLPDIIWSCDEDLNVTFITPNCKEILGIDAETILGQSFATRLDDVHDDDRRILRDAFAAWLATGKPMDVEYRRRRPDGSCVWLRNRGTALYERDGARQLEGMITDITDKKRVDDMLVQAQKMEAVGQLTGGIAHDFNNMLVAILANAHFLMDDLGEHDPRREDAELIKRAAERAAALTRQLLAFSRKQVLAPTVVDLNTTVAGVEKMLRRLIGEDIELAVAPAAGLGTVRVDVGQIEQVLMNLVVNARDAMPRGGRIAIETANVELAADLARGETAGPYVELAVRDDGCGMDAETLRRIFEPFFTTKEVGKGTGLGLATCYGIVKQSGGHIRVDSEPGRGSVFRVLLPRVDSPAAEGRRRADAVRLACKETILLVEDDERVRAVARRIMQSRGYRVIVAGGGAEALALAEAHTGPLHLIVSDVVMPGMNGPDVVAALRRRFGDARALFMSGYTDHPVLRDGALEAGVSFIQKPFAPDALAAKIREVLDG